MVSVLHIKRKSLDIDIVINNFMIKNVLIMVLIFLVVVSGVFVFDDDSDLERTVLWDEAIAILNEGDVEDVFQFHSLDVVLILRDGTQINTVEPLIDDIFDEFFRIVITLGPQVVFPPGPGSARPTMRAPSLISADQFSTIGTKN